MELVAPSLWRLRGWIDDSLNVYYSDGVLIDAATRWHGRYLRRQLKGHAVNLIALTHCHPDHQGAVWFLKRQFGVSLACHRDDVAAMEGRGPMEPPTFIVDRLGRLIAGLPCPVDRVLNDGDVIAGFRVIHAPGHTPGHVIYFRDADRVAIVGDVLTNISFTKMRPGLRLPPSAFCSDPRENIRSVEKLAALKPSLVLFGHGPPLRKTEQLQWFIERLRKRLAKNDGG
jgi:glyoxylase-like metal-dependent hydrolase (beta-lactamase superfamily II)